MDIKINSQEELLKRVRPALRTKKHELMRAGIRVVKENDIWNYNLKKWKEASGLTIADLVNDILNTSNKEYEDYVVNKLKTFRSM